MLFKIFFTLIVIVGLVFLFKFKRVKPTKIQNTNEAQSPIPNAFRTKTSGLNINEQHILKLLQKVVGKSHVQVFPKPQLTTFITLDPSLAPEIQQRLEKELKQIDCDFMLVDTRNFSPIVALSFAPDDRLETVLKDLNVPLIALNKDQTYDEEKFRQLLVHYL